MRTSRFLIALALCAPLMACGATTPMMVQTRLPQVAVPDPQPVVMEGYTWKVYNKADIKALAATLDKHPGKDILIFGVTPDGYKSLSNNYIELQRYIDEQKAVIVYLKKTIADRAEEPAPAK